MAPNADAFTLPDLCDLAAVTPRTVRYYIAQGLLRSPAGAGPGARYDAGHLARLRLIRRLQREHLPLAEIRRRLAALSDAEAIERAAEPVAASGGSALDYIRDALAARGIPPTAAPPPASVLPAAGALAPVAPLAAPARPAATREAPLPPAPTPGAFRADDRPAAIGESAPAARGAGLPARLAEDAAGYGVAAPPESRSQWERITLDPDIELHVRRPLPRAQARAVDHLLAAARQILQEDRS